MTFGISCSLDFSHLGIVSLWLYSRVVFAELENTIAPDFELNESFDPSR